MAVMQHDKDERQLYKVTDASLPFSPSLPAWLARFHALTFEPRPQWPEFSKGCTMYIALTDRLQTSSFPFQAGWYLKRSLERLPQSTSNRQTRPEIKT